MPEFDYKQVSIHQGAPGVGVAISVAVPPGVTLSAERLTAISDAGFALFERLSAEVAHSTDAYRANLALEKASFLAAFGDRRIFAEAVANEHYPLSGRPWYRVTTEAGHFVVGRYKGAIKLDWSGTTDARSADEVFPHRTNEKRDQAIYATDYAELKTLVAVLLGGDAE